MPVYRPKPVSNTRHHNEWLSLIEISGPFLSLPVLTRVFPQGLPEADTERVARLKSAFQEWDANRQSPRSDPAIHRAWLHYVLREGLGFDEQAWREGQSLPPGLEARLEMHGEVLRPTAAIVDPASGKPRLLVQFHDASQNLSKPVKDARWVAPPDARMSELLRATEVPLGLVTNGEQWLLVWAPRGETAGYVTWLASLWFEERVTWRAFAALLGVERFFGVAERDTLEKLLPESAADQQEVTDRLGYQVRRAVEVLVATFDREDRASGGVLLQGVGERQIYEAALIVMMRLVFLFCAEEQKLIPPRPNEIYDANYALSALRARLRETADLHGEEVLEYRKDAWCRLLATFRAVHGGIEHDELKMPAYGGSLFAPDRFPFLEGRAAGTSWHDTPAAPLPIDNRTVLHLLSALQELEIKSGGDREMRLLSFRALDIEQIGHVYEGLLDHTVQRATGPVLSLTGTKFDEPEVELEKLESLVEADAAANTAGRVPTTALLDYLNDQTRRSPQTLRRALEAPPGFEESEKLRFACGNDAGLHARVLPFHALIRSDTFGRPVVIAAGSLFVTQGTDRRSSGTHYTPRSLTEPIVQHTLEPLVYIGPAEGKPKAEWKLKSARELLALKICDMTVGSGAFLVQVARYMAERVVEAWGQQSDELRVMSDELATPDSKLTTQNSTLTSPFGEPATGEPGEQPLPAEPAERLALAKRIVASRCLYGVDKDPLAVEMAKLSLWLITMESDKPFTFLDHAIRSGDSLLGVHDLEQLRHFNLAPNTADAVLFKGPIDEQVDEAVQLRLQLEAMPSFSVEQVQQQEALARLASDKMARLRCAADLLVAANLSEGNAKDRLRAIDRAAVKAGYYVEKGTIAEFEQVAATARQGQEPFHWALEFPEVFGRGGFDAFVGNPPFLGGKKITTVNGTAYRNFLQFHIGNSVKGSADLCAFFFLRVTKLAKAQGGVIGMTATSAMSEGDTREVGLDQIVGNEASIYRAVTRENWSGIASVTIVRIWIYLGGWKGMVELDGTQVKNITPFLTPAGMCDSKPFTLFSNKGKSGIGSYVLGAGFILTTEEANALLAANPKNRDVLVPYLVGEDMNSHPRQLPRRWVINFRDWPLDPLHDDTKKPKGPPFAVDYPDCLSIVQERVRPERAKLGLKADSSAQGYARYWWQFARKALDLQRTMSGLGRVLGISRVTSHATLAFVSPDFVCSESMAIFPFPGYEHFALLQSSLHQNWARAYSSTSLELLRYSPTDCFETFPFPLELGVMREAGESCYLHRQNIMEISNQGLTATYNRFHDRAEQSADIARLRALHVEMDQAVAAAYGWHDLDLGHGFHTTKQGERYTLSDPARREVLDRLLKLNHERYAEEVAAGLHEKGVKKAASKKRKSGATAPQGKQGKPLQQELEL